MDNSALRVLVPSELNPPLNPTLVTDGVGLQKVRSFFERLLNSHTQADPAAFGKDYETNIVPDFYNRRARTLQVGDKHEQFVIDLLAFVDGNTEKLISEQGHYGKHLGRGLLAVKETVEPAFNSNAWMKVGHNLEFEYIVSKWSFGIRSWHFYDTLLAEKIMRAGLVHFDIKDYWGLDDCIARWFGFRVSKDEQKSFDLSTPLTESQVIYGALDTRLPLALRQTQLLGRTIAEPPRGEEGIIKAGLARTCRVEFDAIPAFGDMHMNGLRISHERWQALIDATTAEHRSNIARLDAFFSPVVGRKSDFSMDNVTVLEDRYRDLTVDSEEQLTLKEAIKQTKDATVKAGLRTRLVESVERRKQEKEAAKQAWYAARKPANEVRKLLPDCEGEALINYGSNKQLRAAMLRMKGFNEKNLSNTDDGTLKKLKGKPVIDALRDYRTSEKKLGTYGVTWIRPWVTKPGDEKGWLHPQTGLIHSAFKQLGAETGRTSSTKPNVQNLPKEKKYRAPFIADPPDDEAPEGYFLGSIDMSGAELRIIADAANAETWVEAFLKGQDVHSRSTHILYPNEWPRDALTGCQYFDVNPATGEPLYQKCKCPLHLDRRDGCKSCNFLLAFGGGPRTLAENTGKTEEEATELMGLHKQAFPDVWDFLDRLGKQAVQTFEARDLGGRRRMFTKPNWDKATEKANEKAQARWKRNATMQEINKQLAAQYAAIEREGKNMPIQGTNATIIKRAMGCGFDKNGQPYLWHILEPKFKAKVRNMVHDELVPQWPKRFGEEPKDVIGDAFRRAGAEYLKRVPMEFEGKVGDHWIK
jgi:DNA polymerase I-like protein with 3'-5' exonuclease and polymerase domains